MTATEPNDDDRKERIGSSTRRTFLGAAAAALSLPVVGRASASSPPVASATREDSYSDVQFTPVAGDLMDLEVQPELQAGEISVGGFRDRGASGVSLRWRMDAFEVGTSLDADRARELADRLYTAADVAEGER